MFTTVPPPPACQQVLQTQGQQAARKEVQSRLQAFMQRLPHASQVSGTATQRSAIERQAVRPRRIAKEAALGSSMRCRSC